jgi:hypothetical protein
MTGYVLYADASLGDSWVGLGWAAYAAPGHRPAGSGSAALGRLGEATVAAAEGLAVACGLAWLLDHVPPRGPGPVTVRSDSMEALVACLGYVRPWWTGGRFGGRPPDDPWLDAAAAAVRELRVGLAVTPEWVHRSWNHVAHGLARSARLGFAGEPASGILYGLDGSPGVGGCE